MNKTIYAIGIGFGFLAIGLGAFGAHGLEKLVDADAVATFETGVRYQMYHALFLILLGTLKEVSLKTKKIVLYFITFGVILFSFSIYLLATNSLSAFDFKTIGWVTPIGGLLLLSGWLVLGVQILKKADKEL
ncbi:DUF423 domain-containing protein [Spongiimicrobium salis]|uniref:DUF423 domain-containing protein n=1 Tax=Spongiimicrobium salis TaxID=1667022 RepID=UPI00374DD630